MIRVTRLDVSALYVTAALLPSVERTPDTHALLVHGAPGTQASDRGARSLVSERTTIEVLAPPVVTADRAHSSKNNAALVLLITIGDRRILLAADIEAPAERWLIASGMDLRADVLVVPHHGSNSSSTFEFINAVQPRVAVIPVGAGNPYGHPHPDVLARYQDVMLLRTDEDGDVTLRSDGERLWVETSR